MLTYSPPHKRNFLSASAGVIFKYAIVHSLVGRMTCENTCFTYSFMGTASLFCGIGVALWIAVAVVASNSSDSSKCKC